MAALAARTELSFAQHNRSSYGLAEEVTLHLDTKNVGPQVRATACAAAVASAVVKLVNYMGSALISQSLNRGFCLPALGKRLHCMGCAQQLLDLSMHMCVCVLPPTAAVCAC